MKKYINTIVFIFCFLTVGVLAAQDIKGIVMSKNTQEPLADVYVFAKGKIAIASTDEHGVYSIPASLNLRNNDELTFSHVGFLDVRLTIKTLYNNSTIYLEETEELLNEVTVVGKKKVKTRVDYEEIASLNDRLFAFGAAMDNGKIYVDGGNLSRAQNAFLTGELVGNESDGMPMLTKMMEAQRRSFVFNEYSDNMSVYDIANDTWEVVDKTFRKRAFHKMLHYKGKMYVFGGRYYSRNHRFEYLDNMTEVFDIANDTIILDNTNPHEAVNFAAVNFKGNFVLFGGAVKQLKNGNVQYSKAVHLFDATSGYWYALKDMPEAKEVNGVLLGDDVYLIGGFNGKELKTIENFNLKTGEWSQEGELITAMEYPALATLGNTIYMFENGILATYDVNTKSLKEYYINLQLFGSHIFIYQNEMYIIGGQYRNRGIAMPSSKCYKVSLQKLQNTKIMHTSTLQ